MTTGVLAAVYALHLAATVIWIGGLAFLALLLPALLARLPAEERQALQTSARGRYRPLAWLSLALFAGTGLAQMSASPNYEGLFVIGSPWAAAICVKHLVIAAMVAILVYQTLRLHPLLERYRLGLERPQAGKPEELHRRDELLLRASLALGGVVLMLTAVARANV